MQLKRVSSMLAARLRAWSGNSVFLLAFFITVAAIFFRFYNSENVLFFIYDQGRDAWALQSLAAGDLTLIGPTSGLQGFFLGPFWYYIGLPGFLLTGGSPYGIGLWYVALTCLAFPLYWQISKKLFPNQTVWQLSLFALLCFVPGSLHGSLFIWNPLLSIPLLAAAIWCLFQARKSVVFLGVAFLLLGLMLHAEFAYGVFLIPVLFVLIFWIRQRFALRDYCVAAVAIGVTILPQAVFELRNDFLMTKALVAGILGGQDSVSLLQVWRTRPLQLFTATQDLLVGNLPGGVLIAAVAVGLIGWAFYWLRAHARTLLTADTRYFWQLIGVIAVTPFVGFLFWTGNSGNFFSYYITAHFIVLAPLLLLGAKTLLQLPLFAGLTKQTRNTMAIVIPAVLVASLLTFSWQSLAQRVIWPHNDASMRVIDQATELVLDWEAHDRQRIESARPDLLPYTSATVTYTPNVYTAQYDYFLHWRSSEREQRVPNTQLQDEHALVYAIIEPDRELPERSFIPWYQRVTAERVLVRRVHMGVLVLETWARPELVLDASVFEPYQPAIGELLGW